MIGITSSDLEIFEQIENRRAEIIKKDIPLEIIDYGAGSPNSKRTTEEMYHGNKLSTSTSKMCAVGLKKEWAEYIYKLIKTYQPKIVLELGTCCGFSSIYMSKALNNESSIYTIEGAESLAQVAQKNRESLGCKNVTQVVGRFQDVLNKTLIKLQKVDFIFIDGHHDEYATIKYFKEVKPFLSENAIIVFDDISWSEGMKRAWKQIIQDSDIKEYENLTKLGVCYF